MKKNVMMRVASAMLVLTLLTTCIISGTFAKYTTKGEFQDSARVAKWGVTIKGTGTTFADAYEAGTTTATARPNAPSASVTVRSETEGDKVVAPGTEGSLARFTITGKPEVSVDVTYTATLTLTGWEIPAGTATEEYCPLVFTVNGTEYYIGKDNITTVAALTTAVNGAIAAYSKSYAAGTDLSTVDANDALSVSWKWNYEDNVVSCQENAKDTALGNWAMRNAEAPTISLAVTATATQKD